MPFAVSAGRVEQLNPAANAFAWTPGALRISERTYETYETVWRTQPALRTVVSFLARNIADLGIDVFERLSDTDRRKAGDHRLAKLLTDPFPGSKWTKYRLINWTVHELAIFDNAFWLKSSASSGLPALIPVPRRMIAVRGDNPFAPEAYRLTGSRGWVDLSPDDVVHFHGYNPDDTRLGCSPIEGLRQVLAEEHAAARYREQLWRNGARIGGYISRPEKAPRWSTEARDRFQRSWQEQYTGDTPFAGGSPVLEDGMTYTASGISPKDAQYVESRQLTREEVAIAYHIDPSMLGLMKGQTVGNAPEAHRMLYSETFGPWLEFIQQDIERQVLPDLEPNPGRFYVEFNLRKKMQGSFEQQAAALSASVGGPWMLRSEARAMFNLPEVDGADELVVPMNVTHGGLASPRDTAPDNPSNEQSNGEPPGPKPITE